MARLILEGLTPEQAKELGDWFEGQGEQDCAIWFECRDIPSPIADICRKGGCIETKGDDTILYCRTT